MFLYLLCGEARAFVCLLVSVRSYRPVCCHFKCEAEIPVRSQVMSCLQNISATTLHNALRFTVLCAA